MPAPAPARGRFIVLDGIDGCGKTTQAELLVQTLERRSGRAPLHLREPGSTPLGEGIRDLLLSRRHQLDAGVETLLFAASRRQMLAERVEPALAEGRDVVCERFNSSTFAYQAVAGALELEAVFGLLQGWSSRPAPDRVVLLEVDPERAAARRGAPADRIEDKGLEFQRRVAEGFRSWARRDPATRVVDGEGEPAEVAARVLAEVEGGA